MRVCSIIMRIRRSGRCRPCRRGIAALLVAAAMTTGAFAAGAGVIVEGQPFPDIVLPDLETGEPTSLSRYRGERVVLHVFASW